MIKVFDQKEWLKMKPENNNVVWFLNELEMHFKQPILKTEVRSTRKDVFLIVTLELTEVVKKWMKYKSKDSYGEEFEAGKYISLWWKNPIRENSFFSYEDRNDIPS
jgi:hypothetical protein